MMGEEKKKGGGGGGGDDDATATPCENIQPSSNGGPPQQNGAPALHHHTPNNAPAANNVNANNTSGVVTVVAPVAPGTNVETLPRAGKQGDLSAGFLRTARAGQLEKVLEYLDSGVDINTSNQNGLNALHLAAKDGHLEIVKELLSRGAIVDAATKKGNTALHIASLAGQEEVVHLLVERGASVNAQSQNGFTPLYMAAQENHDSVVKFLLNKGANQTLATEDGFTPLAVAMQQGHDKVVAVLLENDTRGKVRLPALHIAAKKDDCKAAALLLQKDHNPDVTSKSGFTPLHIAAHYGNDRIASLLYDKGADVNFAAKHNITPMHVAAKWGKIKMVNLLIAKGANIEAKTRDGLTPLHCAARSGHHEVVDILIEKGAPIGSKTKNGLAPLHMASQGDHVDAARILLYHRAPVDEVTVDYLTALHVAAHCGHVRVAKLLLDRNADPNARALNGFTPLHIACKKNRIKVVELLLKHKASIEATTESGLTPLHVASFMGCMNIVIYLLQHEASPDIPTVRGETPLHLAARANQTDIIRILLRNGAQVDARAREEQTPLHVASRLGNVDIVMLLLQHGANVDATTKDVYTPLHIAAKEGQEEVASVLLDNGASNTTTTKKGFTPLHLAAKYGNMNVARLLLQKNAPVDAQGKNGVTPLHVASHYDHQNVALLLLDKGASPHAMAKNGHTPLHIAARKNQMDIATTLLEYGAKANAESKAGFTPLHLSAQEGHTDMSTLLIEHKADTNHKAKNGLTPLHLCAQEDKVNVASILVKNGAQIDAKTKAGYTPLHVAAHFGQAQMVRFLLSSGASVNCSTSAGYTPLHHAAQQGHTLVINLLLEGRAQPNLVTKNGQTALDIAQKLGYITVVETLKVVTETIITTSHTITIEEKYKVQAPESMQETFMSDSEDEGGEDPMLSDHQQYQYMNEEAMKSMGDDSLRVNVTDDERDNRHSGVPTITEMITKESYRGQMVANLKPDNIDINRHPVHVGFLVSFLVDARGGAMRGCRHSGVRVIVPPRKATMPMRVTCRYLKRDKLTHPPPLMEGEALASRILELAPVAAKFLGPVIIEVPHFASLRGKEREIVILRSDNGETWREHTLEASEEAVQDVLNESFEGEELSQLEDLQTSRIVRILTVDFPHYFAVVSRIRQEVHAVGPEGGTVSSSAVPQVQAIFPPAALTKKIRVGLQAHPIPAELVAKLLGNRVAVSPIVTVEPRRRKFHKPISLTVPLPQAANKGMINQYSGDAPTLRLLCSITGLSHLGGQSRAVWEDVTGSTPLTFLKDCVSFTTTVSARFWLMDCRNISEATKMATELYTHATHVPFMAKFVVFAKRVDPQEARLRVFCMTDDKEDKTLEHQEHFTEVAKSRDVEVLEGKTQYLEFAGNLIPVLKSGEQLQLPFRAFKENRIPFTVRIKDPDAADMMGRIMFMNEPKVAKGEPPQTPICTLNILLPDKISPGGNSELDLLELSKNYSFLRDGGLSRPDAIHRATIRLTDIANLLDKDWENLALELNVTPNEISQIKEEHPDKTAQQATAMFKLWQSNGNKATGNTLEKALNKIGREDIVKKCIFNVELVTDDVEKAVARVRLDQPGFDTLKDELGPSRDTSLRRDATMDPKKDPDFEEPDRMKDSESVEDLSISGAQNSNKQPSTITNGIVYNATSTPIKDKYASDEKELIDEMTDFIEHKYHTTDTMVKQSRDELDDDNKKRQDVLEEAKRIVSGVKQDAGEEKIKLSKKGWLVVYDNDVRKNDEVGYVVKPQEDSFSVDSVGIPESPVIRQQCIIGTNGDRTITTITTKTIITSVQADATDITKDDKDIHDITDYIDSRRVSRDGSSIAPDKDTDKTPKNVSGDDCKENLGDRKKRSENDEKSKTKSSDRKKSKSSRIFAGIFKTSKSKKNESEETQNVPVSFEEDQIRETTAKLLDDIRKMSHPETDDLNPVSQDGSTKRIVDHFDRKITPKESRGPTDIDEDCRHSSFFDEPHKKGADSHHDLKHKESSGFLKIFRNPISTTKESKPEEVLGQSPLDSTNNKQFLGGQDGIKSETQKFLEDSRHVASRMYVATPTTTNMLDDPVLFSSNQVEQKISAGTNKSSQNERDVLLPKQVTDFPLSVAGDSSPQLKERTKKDLENDDGISHTPVETSTFRKKKKPGGLLSGILKSAKHATEEITQEARNFADETTKEAEEEEKKAKNGAEEEFTIIKDDVSNYAEGVKAGAGNIGSDKSSVEKNPRTQVDIDVMTDVSSRASSSSPLKATTNIDVSKIDDNTHGKSLPKDVLPHSKGDHIHNSGEQGVKKGKVKKSSLFSGIFNKSSEQASPDPVEMSTKLEMRYSQDLSETIKTYSTVNREETISDPSNDTNDVKFLHGSSISAETFGTEIGDSTNSDFKNGVDVEIIQQGEISHANDSQKHAMDAERKPKKFFSGIFQGARNAAGGVTQVVEELAEEAEQEAIEDEVAISVKRDQASESINKKMKEESHASKPRERQKSFEVKEEIGMLSPRSPKIDLKRTVCLEESTSGEILEQKMESGDSIRRTKDLLEDTKSTASSLMLENSESHYNLADFDRNHSSKPLEGSKQKKHATKTGLLSGLFKKSTSSSIEETDANRDSFKYNEVTKDGTAEHDGMKEQEKRSGTRIGINNDETPEQNTGLDDSIRRTKDLLENMKSTASSLMPETSEYNEDLADSDRNESSKPFEESKQKKNRKKAGLLSGLFKKSITTRIEETDAKRDSDKFDEVTTGGTTECNDGVEEQGNQSNVPIEINKIIITSQKEVMGKTIPGGGNLSSPISGSLSTGDILKGSYPTTASSGIRKNQRQIEEHMIRDPTIVESESTQNKEKSAGFLAGIFKHPKLGSKSTHLQLPGSTLETKPKSINSETTSGTGRVLEGLETPDQDEGNIKERDRMTSNETKSEEGSEFDKTATKDFLHDMQLFSSSSGPESSVNQERESQVLAEESPKKKNLLADLLRIPKYAAGKVAHDIQEFVEETEREAQEEKIKLQARAEHPVVNVNIDVDENPKHDRPFSDQANLDEVDNSNQTDFSLVSNMVPLGNECSDRFHKDMVEDDPDLLLKKKKSKESKSLSGLFKNTKLNVRSGTRDIPTRPEATSEQTADSQNITHPTHCVGTDSKSVKPILHNDEYLEPENISDLKLRNKSSKVTPTGMNVPTPETGLISSEPFESQNDDFVQDRPNKKRNVFTGLLERAKHIVGEVADEAEDFVKITKEETLEEETKIGLEEKNKKRDVTESITAGRFSRIAELPPSQGIDIDNSITEEADSLVGDAQNLRSTEEMGKEKKKRKTGRLFSGISRSTQNSSETQSPDDAVLPQILSLEHQENVNLDDKIATTQLLNDMRLSLATSEPTSESESSVVEKNATLLHRKVSSPDMILDQEASLRVKVDTRNQNDPKRERSQEEQRRNKSGGLISGILKTIKHSAGASEKGDDRSNTDNLAELDNDVKSVRRQSVNQSIEPTTTSNPRHVSDDSTVVVAVSIKDDHKFSDGENDTIHELNLIHNDAKAELPPLRGVIENVRDTSDNRNNGAEASEVVGHETPHGIKENPTKSIGSLDSPAVNVSGDGKTRVTHVKVKREGFMSGLFKSAKKTADGASDKDKNLSREVEKDLLGSYQESIDPIDRGTGVASKLDEVVQESLTVSEGSLKVRSEPHHEPLSGGENVKSVLKRDRKAGGTEKGTIGIFDSRNSPNDLVATTDHHGSSLVKKNEEKSSGFFSGILKNAKSAAVGVVHEVEEFIHDTEKNATVEEGEFKSKVVSGTAKKGRKDFKSELIIVDEGISGLEDSVKENAGILVEHGRPTVHGQTDARSQENTESAHDVGRRITHSDADKMEHLDWVTPPSQPQQSTDKKISGKGTGFFSSLLNSGETSIVAATHDGGELARETKEEKCDIASTVIHRNVDMVYGLDDPGTGLVGVFEGITKSSECTSGEQPSKVKNAKPSSKNVSRDDHTPGIADTLVIDKGLSDVTDDGGSPPTEKRIQKSGGFLSGIIKSAGSATEGVPHEIDKLVVAIKQDDMKGEGKIRNEVSDEYQESRLKLGIRIDDSLVKVSEMSHDLGEASEVLPDAREIESCAGLNELKDEDVDDKGREDREMISSLDKNGDSPNQTSTEFKKVKVTDKGYKDKKEGFFSNIFRSAKKSTADADKKAAKALKKNVSSSQVEAMTLMDQTTGTAEVPDEAIEESSNVGTDITKFPDLETRGKLGSNMKLEISSESLLRQGISPGTLPGFSSGVSDSATLIEFERQGCEESHSERNEGNSRKYPSGILENMEDRSGSNAHGIKEVEQETITTEGRLESEVDGRIGNMAAMSLETQALDSSQEVPGMREQVDGKSSSTNKVELIGQKIPVEVSQIKVQTTSPDAVLVIESTGKSTKKQKSKGAGFLHGIFKGVASAQGVKKDPTERISATQEDTPVSSDPLNEMTESEDAIHDIPRILSHDSNSIREHLVLASGIESTASGGRAPGRNSPVNQINYTLDEQIPVVGDSTAKKNEDKMREFLSGILDSPRSIPGNTAYQVNEFLEETRREASEEVRRIMESPQKWKEVSPRVVARNRSEQTSQNLQTPVMCEEESTILDKQRDLNDQKIPDQIQGTILKSPRAESISNVMYTAHDEEEGKPGEDVMYSITQTDVGESEPSTKKGKENTGKFFSGILKGAKTMVTGIVHDVKNLTDEIENEDIKNEKQVRLASRKIIPDAERSTNDEFQTYESDADPEIGRLRPDENIANAFTPYRGLHNQEIAGITSKDTKQIDPLRHTKVIESVNVSNKMSSTPAVPSGDNELQEIPTAVKSSDVKGRSKKGGILANFMKSGKLSSERQIPESGKSMAISPVEAINVNNTETGSHETAVDFLCTLESQSDNIKEHANTSNQELEATDSTIEETVLVTRRKMEITSKDTSPKVSSSRKKIDQSPNNLIDASLSPVTVSTEGVADETDSIGENIGDPSVPSIQVDKRKKSTLFSGFFKRSQNAVQEIAHGIDDLGEKTKEEDIKTEREMESATQKALSHIGTAIEDAEIVLNDRIQQADEELSSDKRKIQEDVESFNGAVRIANEGVRDGAGNVVRRIDGVKSASSDIVSDIHHKMDEFLAQEKVEAGLVRTEISEQVVSTINNSKEKSKGILSAFLKGPKRVAEKLTVKTNSPSKLDGESSSDKQEVEEDIESFNTAVEIAKEGVRDGVGNVIRRIDGVKSASSDIVSDIHLKMDEFLAQEKVEAGSVRTEISEQVVSTIDKGKENSRGILSGFLKGPKRVTEKLMVNTNSSSELDEKSSSDKQEVEEDIESFNTAVEIAKESVRDGVGNVVRSIDGVKSASSDMVSDIPLKMSEFLEQEKVDADSVRTEISEQVVSTIDKGKEKSKNILPRFLKGSKRATKISTVRTNSPSELSIKQVSESPEITVDEMTTADLETDIADDTEVVSLVHGSLKVSKETDELMSGVAVIKNSKLDLAESLNVTLPSVEDSYTSEREILDENQAQRSSKPKSGVLASIIKKTKGASHKIAKEFDHATENLKDATEKFWEDTKKESMESKLSGSYDVTPSKIDPEKTKDEIASNSDLSLELPSPLYSPLETTHDTESYIPRVIQSCHIREESTVQMVQESITILQSGVSSSFSHSEPQTHQTVTTVFKKSVRTASTPPPSSAEFTDNASQEITEEAERRAQILVDARSLGKSENDLLQQNDPTFMETTTTEIDPDTHERITRVTRTMSSGHGVVEDREELRDSMHKRVDDFISEERRGQ